MGKVTPFLISLKDPLEECEDIKVMIYHFILVGRGYIINISPYTKINSLMISEREALITDASSFNFFPTSFAYKFATKVLNIALHYIH